MASARAEELVRVGLRLGFHLNRQAGSHQRWIHADGRSVTIPVHGGREIGPPLFQIILQQLGISLEEFRRLK